MRDPVPTRVAWAAAGARRASLKPPVSGPGQRDALQALPHWAQHRGRRRGHCGGSEARAAKPRPPAGYQAPPFTLQPSAAQARVNLSRNKLTAGKKAIASCQDDTTWAGSRAHIFTTKPVGSHTVVQGHLGSPFRGSVRSELFCVITLRCYLPFSLLGVERRVLGRL